MAAPQNIQPNPGASDTGVAAFDAAGNETIAGNLVLQHGAIVLGAVAAAPGAVPGALVLYTTDGVTLSMGGAGGQAAAQSVPGALSIAGVASLNGGSNTAGSAPVLTPTFANGTAAQLTDTTRDYMVYFQVGTVGTAFTLAIGPTAGVANALMASATPGADEAISFRLPAGWFVKWAGTGTTLATQIAIGC